MAKGIGGIALGSLFAEDGFGMPRQQESFRGLPSLPHFAPKAKRCIYLHMMGAPPQMDLLDYKPKMKDWYDKDLPESVRQGQRLTTMASGQSRFPTTPSVFPFAQYGQSGAWMSELLPETAKMVDDITVIRSMHTEVINHEPGITPHRPIRWVRFAGRSKRRYCPSVASGDGSVRAKYFFRGKASNRRHRRTTSWAREESWRW